MADFKTEIERRIHQEITGSTADVTRDPLRGDLADRSSTMLRDVGRFLTPYKDNKDFAGVDYLGSAAIHIYGFKNARGSIDLFYISQANTLVDAQGRVCPEPFASKGFEDLRGAMQTLYGKGRQSTRSGF